MKTATLDTAPSLSFWNFGRTNYTLNGRLVHPNGDPRMHQKVKAYAKIWFFRFHIGTFTTDRDGKFHLNYRWWQLPFISKQRILFKVFEEKVHCTTRGIEPAGERVVFEQTIRTNPTKTEQNVGDVPIELYEYRSDRPDLRLPDKESMRPQQQSPFFFLKLFFATFDETIKDFFVRLFSGFLNVESVEKIYGVEEPDLEVNEETTIDLLLNGIFPAHFKKGKRNELLVEINWDGYEKDDSPQIPNVELALHHRNGELSIKSVSIQFQGQKKQIYKKTDPLFTQGLRLFNGMAMAKGELFSHLGLGHFWSGQAAMAIFRSLNKNPLKALLFPHLKGSLEINRLGRTAVFGEEGGLNVTGLSTNGIQQALKNILGSVCYTNFKPRDPINDTHRFAKAENLYWEALNATIDQFFSEHQNGIQEHWYEIYYLSKNLVENSPPYTPIDRKKYFDQNEIDDPTVPGRIIHDGATRAIRPITSDQVFKKTEDLEKLKQFCRYALFTVTFWHWSVHISQRKWLTNLKLGSLAPENNGQGPYAGTSVKNAQRQLSLIHTLTDFQPKTLLGNPDGDIYPFFIEQLQARAEQFMELGYDITKLSAGTVI